MNDHQVSTESTPKCLPTSRSVIIQTQAAAGVDTVEAWWWLDVGLIVEKKPTHVNTILNQKAVHSYNHHVSTESPPKSLPTSRSVVIQTQAAAAHTGPSCTRPPWSRLIMCVMSLRLTCKPRNELPACVRMTFCRSQIFVFWH